MFWSTFTSTWGSHRSGSFLKGKMSSQTLSIRKDGSIYFPLSLGSSLKCYGTSLYDTLSLGFGGCPSQQVHSYVCYYAQLSIVHRTCWPKSVILLMKLGRPWIIMCLCSMHHQLRQLMTDPSSHRLLWLPHGVHCQLGAQPGHGLRSLLFSWATQAFSK